MYAAKHAGRNRCRFFDQGMQDAALNRISIISDLHSAVPRELRLFFQPIVDLKTGCISKAEALLRWQHPERGLMLPGEFVPLAEEAGLIGGIGEWVLEEAANWAARWSALRGETLQVSINKSPLEFSGRGQDARLDIGALLRRMGLGSGNLSVEITEGVLLHASAQVRENMLRLREAGIEVSIDDFGTGYSSMSYLRQYDADYLKIDKSFISDKTGDQASGAIAETIIVMAHKLGLGVIAEGIERPDQHDWLTAAGCDYGQGYLYSPPVEPERFELLLRAHGPLAPPSGLLPS
jgi:EAL domain-containing protein (putative c-di-GMP-specific phosphodiesterase class I)